MEKEMEKINVIKKTEKNYKQKLYILQTYVQIYV